MNDCARGVFDACVDVVDDCVTLCGGLANYLLQIVLLQRAFLNSVGKGLVLEVKVNVLSDEYPFVPASAYDTLHTLKELWRWCAMVPVHCNN